MADLLIFIKARKKADGGYELVLTDSDANHGVDDLKSKTSPGSMVKWILAGFSDVKIEKIVNINAKDGSFDIFKEGPKPETGGKTWFGVVGEDMGGKMEEYFIEYQIDGQKYVCDPEIRVPDGKEG